MNRPRTDLSSWVINDVRAGVKFHRQLGKPKVQLYTCNLNLVLYGAAGLRLHLLLAVFPISALKWLGSRAVKQCFI